MGDCPQSCVFDKPPRTLFQRIRETKNPAIKSFCVLIPWNLRLEFVHEYLDYACHTSANVVPPFVVFVCFFSQPQTVQIFFRQGCKLVGMENEEEKNLKYATSLQFSTSIEVQNKHRSLARNISTNIWTIQQKHNAPWVSHRHRALAYTCICASKQVP